MMKRWNLCGLGLLWALGPGCDASADSGGARDTTGGVFVPGEIIGADTQADGGGDADVSAEVGLDSASADGVVDSGGVDSEDSGGVDSEDSGGVDSEDSGGVDSAVVDGIGEGLGDSGVVETGGVDSVDTRVESADTSVADSSTPMDSAPAPEDTWVVPAPEAPIVAYSLGGERTLFFLNNPEQLIASDLGDAALGDTTLYRVTASGACRSFFEHVNRANRTLGFGIQAYNPGPATVTVTVRAAGWVASILGGVPFADAFNGAGAAAPVQLTAGQSTWIFRKDEAVSHNTFFSGVVDFDVAGGSVIVNHTAYDSFAGLDGSTSVLGYVQRVEPDGTHEARMYKGIATASEAVVDTLELTFDEATPAGALPLRVARYDLGGGFAAPIEVGDWTTHIGPAQNPSATTSDMVAFSDGAWHFDPRVASDGEGKHPNLGNWGVVYRLVARVTNEGPAQRTVSYRMTASPGAGAGFAKRAQGGAWSAHRLEKGVSLELGAVVVPAGTTRELVVEWVLGGPSGGGVKNALQLD